MRKAPYLAAENGQLRALQYLFERRGHVMFDGFALRRAAELGHIAIVEYLADMGKMSDIGDALSAAAKAGRLDVVRLIQERYHPDKTALAHAIVPATNCSCEMLALVLEFCPLPE